MLNYCPISKVKNYSNRHLYINIKFSVKLDIIILGSFAFVVYTRALVFGDLWLDRCLYLYSITFDFALFLLHPVI